MQPFLKFPLCTCRVKETIGTLEKDDAEDWTDQEVVERVRAGETALYEIIMRRYNQRLYRVARDLAGRCRSRRCDAGRLRNQHLEQFSGRVPFSAWLTRIAVNEALGRLRLRKCSQQLEDTEDDGELRMNIVETFA